MAGCGPCGLAVAALLARDGHCVTIVEQFDRPRPIGSGLMLQPTGLAVLERLGLADAARHAGAPIARLLGKTPQGRVVLDVSYDALREPGLNGIGIHRATLFSLLLGAASSAGARIETGRTVTGMVREGRWRRLRFADGGISAGVDLVVDALGTRSPLAPAVGRTLAYGALWTTLDWPSEGFDPARLEQRYRAASRMVGVLPVGRLPGGERAEAALFWSLRADRLDEWRRQGLERWKAEVRALWPATAPLLNAVVDQDQFVFARYAHRTLPSPAGAGIVHLGDAWHSASPQLGQGANMALLDAWALRQGLRGAGTLDEALAATVALRRRHVRMYQRLTALLTPVYQSDGALLPFLRDWIVPPLARVPAARRLQARLVAGLVGNPLQPLELT